MMPRTIAVGILMLGVAVGFYALGSRIGAPTDVTREFAGPRAAGVRLALDEPHALLRYPALPSPLLDLPHEDLESVLAVYEERLELLPPGQGEIDLLAEAWAAIDPEGAIDHVNAWPEESRQMAIPAVVRAWALRAPIAAFTWAETLDAEARTAAIENVFRGWAASGDPEVWKFLATLLPGWHRETATNVVMQWVARTQGFEALLEQVAAIEPDVRPGNPRDFKLAALRTAVGLCAYYEPARALAFARRFAGGPYDNNLLRRVAVFWAVKDGPAAMAALLDLPSEPQRDLALRDGYRKWLRADGQAALDSMPADAADDERYAPLIDLYAIAYSNKQTGDPIVAIRTAARWADRVPDSEVRHDTAVRIGVEWLRREPDAARVWIQQHGLGPDVEAAQRRQTAIQRPRGSRGSEKPARPRVR